MGFNSGFKGLTVCYENENSIYRTFQNHVCTPEDSMLHMQDITDRAFRT